MAHDQAGTRLALKLAQNRVQFHQGFANKFHAPVDPWQWRQNVSVEDKNAVHTRTLA